MTEPTGLVASFQRMSELSHVIEDYIEQGSRALMGHGLSQDDVRLVQIAAKNAPFLTLPSLTEEEAEAQIREAETEASTEPGM